MTQNAEYGLGLFPRDGVAYNHAHQSNWVHPVLTDPMARLNQSAIIDTDLFSGVEGWDYQNPYVWTSRQLLTVATLETAYGIPSDSDVSVALNVMKTHGALLF